MSSKSYFVTVEFEVMGDDADEVVAQMGAALESMQEGDILDAQIKDVEENAPLDEEIG